MNTTDQIPQIHITYLDEQSARQDELRELYLRWVSNHEVRLKGVQGELLLRPTRKAVPCTFRA